MNFSLIELQDKIITNETHMKTSGFSSIYFIIYSCFEKNIHMK